MAIGMTRAEINEKFGPYELVAKFYKGEHRGILWRSGEKLIEVTATSNSEAKEMIEARFYERGLKRAAEQGEVVPSDKRMVAALRYIWPHLNAAQEKLLQAQYRAPGRRMTTMELATVVGWKSHRPVNAHYGRAGFMLFNEVPRVLPISKGNEAPVYSFALSIGVGNPEEQGDKAWIWEMRPEVARGLKIAGLVST